jgi:hypothetical protein
MSENEVLIDKINDAFNDNESVVSSTTTDDMYKKLKKKKKQRHYLKEIIKEEPEEEEHKEVKCIHYGFLIYTIIFFILSLPQLNSLLPNLTPINLCMIKTLFFFILCLYLKNYSFQFKY